MDQADDGRESGMHFGDAALYASGQVMQKNVQRAMHTTGHDLQSMLAGVAEDGRGRGGRGGRKQKQGGLKKNATFFKNAFEKLAGR